MRTPQWLEEAEIKTTARQFFILGWPSIDVQMGKMFACLSHLVFCKFPYHSGIMAILCIPVIFANPMWNLLLSHQMSRF